MTTDALILALVAHCQPGWPEGITVRQPGDANTPAPSSTWAEFWIDSVSSNMGRRTGPAIDQLTITVNCYARPPASAISASTLAESIRYSLRGTTIPISNESTTTGHVRLIEPELHDASQPATTKSAGIWHWMVTVRGTFFPIS